MSAIGSIDPNPDAIGELFRAMVNCLSNKQARLAIWLVEEFDLSQFNYQVIGAKSPFTGSDSKLAGSGFLISLQSTNIDKLIDTFFDRLAYEILHIEIEAKDDIQFKAFDHFGYVLFGDEISVDMLEALKTRGVIYQYEVFDEDKTGRQGNNI